MAAERAAIYTRVSTRAQDTEDTYSLQQQEDETRAWCRDHGYSVDHFFQEVHTGYELDERPKLTALRKLIQHREIDVLVIMAYDRLARNFKHQTLIGYDCDKRNIRIEAVREKTDNTPQGQLMRQFYAMLGEYERQKIKDRTSDGLRGRAKSGKLLPGYMALYGYTYADAKKSAYEIDPVTGPIVRRIFDSALAGLSIRQIVNMLNRERIPSPRDWYRAHAGDPVDPPQGASWPITTIANILKSPTYCGQHSAYRWKRTAKEETDEITGDIRKKKRSILKTRHGEIALPDAAPAIVTLEEFEAVQRQLVRNSTGSVRNNHAPEHALLRGGVVRCATCHGRMTVQSYKYHTKDSDQPIRSYAYVCWRTGETGDRACSGARILCPKLDELVWNDLAGILSNPKELLDAARAQFERPDESESAASYREIIADLDKQMKSTARRMVLLSQSEGQDIEIDQDDPLVREYHALEQLSIRLSRQSVASVHEPRDRILLGDRLKRHPHGLP